MDAAGLWNLDQELMPEIKMYRKPSDATSTVYVPTVNEATAADVKKLMFCQRRLHQLSIGAHSELEQLPRLWHSWLPFRALDAHYMSSSGCSPQAILLNVRARPSWLARTKNSMLDKVDRKCCTVTCVLVPELLTESSQGQPLAHIVDSLRAATGMKATAYQQPKTETLIVVHVVIIIHLLMCPI